MTNYFLSSYEADGSKTLEGTYSSLKKAKQAAAQKGLDSFEIRTLSTVLYKDGKRTASGGIAELANFLGI